MCLLLTFRPAKAKVEKEEYIPRSQKCQAGERSQSHFRWLLCRESRAVVTVESVFCYIIL